MSKRTKQIVLSVIVTIFVFVFTLGGKVNSAQAETGGIDFSIFDELIAIDREMSEIDWDLEVGDVPPEKEAEKNKRLADLSAQYHSLFTSKRMEDFFEAVEAAWDDADDITIGIYRKAKGDYDKLTCIPEEEYRYFSELQMRAYSAWVEAKGNSDFSIFSPYLEELVEYQKKFIGYRLDKGFVYDNPYDAMLDDFEPGMTVAVLDKFFDELRRGVVPLLERVMSAEKIISGDFRYREVPLDVQRKFSPFLMETAGFDMERGQLRECEHSFTMPLGRNDTRITTHYYENDFFASFYGVMHESGHAIYEQNIAPELDNTILGTGASYGIHESQSRFFENMAGRNRAFLEGIYDDFILLTDGYFDDISAHELYEAVNIVRPSPIRITADELTYSLHIMVRYEIEKMLFNEPDLKIDDLPGIWNEKMQEYLGVTPANDAEGILQDVHWSNGEFGYFPTYALGNAYSAQILNAMEKDIDVQSSLRAADFSEIDAWLTEKIHKYGALLSPDEILAQITKEGFSPRYYIRYLTNKYESLYDLPTDSGGCAATKSALAAALLILAAAAARGTKR